MILELPAELRNRIYRDCLVEERPIKLFERSSEPRRHGVAPALLRTCSQIRSEAIEIYYLENRFEAVVEDCDVGEIEVWIDSCISPLGEDVAMKLRLVLYALVPNNRPWTNLMSWCRAIYDGVFYLVRFELEFCYDVNQAEEGVITTAVDMAKVARDLPWTEVFEMLRKLQWVAVATDTVWDDEWD